MSIQNGFKIIHKLFQELIAWLIYERQWAWLELLISVLCDIEMSLKLLKDKELKFYTDNADEPTYNNKNETNSDVAIPKNTLYCNDCLYKSYSKLAKFFYGEQSCGYCYYLEKGDFSFTKSTMLLWDGCKECGKFLEEN